MHSEQGSTQQAGDAYYPAKSMSMDDLRAQIDITLYLYEQIAGLYYEKTGSHVPEIMDGQVVRLMRTWGIGFDLNPRLTEIADSPEFVSEEKAAERIEAFRRLSPDDYKRRMAALAQSIAGKADTR